MNVSPRLIEALNVRYTQGDRPTYTAEGPQGVFVRLRKDKDDTWRQLSLIGGETFSPVSAFMDGNGSGHIAMVPLSIKMSAEIAKVRVSMHQAADTIRGFSAQLLEVSELIDDDTMREIVEERKRIEAQALFDEQERVRIMASPDWGAF